MLLTVDERATCGRYTPRVRDFGKRLRDFRIAKGMKNATAVARRALGAGREEKEYRDFAAYLSKIELGDAPANLTMEKLEQLAKGLNEPTLSSFFAGIEKRHATGKQLSNSLGREVHDDFAIPPAFKDDGDLTELSARVVRFIVEESTGVRPTRGRTQNSGETKPPSQTPAGKGRSRSSDKS